MIDEDRLVEEIAEIIINNRSRMANELAPEIAKRVNEILADELRDFIDYTEFCLYPKNPDVKAGVDLAVDALEERFLSE